MGWPQHSKLGGPWLGSVAPRALTLFPSASRASSLSWLHAQPVPPSPGEPNWEPGCDSQGTP